eukprot:CAMPEP_0172535602 /NCGR_PEP_ID=MMETSP1067-20121228/7535_1 /TAXON_ID=265564 ORGANISM="Thalassiosira punctigera, Strain Tpunct2005C2" /NCGR_SAMPLE_ID=MMETSP1067 /ASSEMBLY_ACC=CAM_ASM_000444 /LENGTH=380 /DNA_ID=CAMNT_0013320541 /DNA_START=115 /DNA_END=1259 /DNA_ORIENTATION=+
MTEQASSDHPLSNRIASNSINLRSEEDAVAIPELLPALLLLQELVQLAPLPGVEEGLRDREHSFHRVQHERRRHPVGEVPPEVQLERVLGVERVLPRGYQRDGEQVGPRARHPLPRREEVVVPLLQLRAPDEVGSVVEVLDAAQGELLPRRDADGMGLGQRVPHPQLQAVAVLAESHGDVGGVEVVDGVQLADVVDLGVPALSSLGVHDELGELHPVARSLHGRPPSEEGRAEVLEVVDAVDLVDHLALPPPHLLPFLSRRRGLVVHRREPAALPGPSALDRQLGQGRHGLDPAEELVEVRELDLHPLRLRRGRALQRRSFLEDGTAERRDAAGPGGNEEEASDQGRGQGRLGTEGATWDEELSMVTPAVCSYFPRRKSG